MVLVQQVGIKNEEQVMEACPRGTHAVRWSLERRVHAGEMEFQFAPADWSNTLRTLRRQYLKVKFEASCFLG